MPSVVTPARVSPARPDPASPDPTRRPCRSGWLLAASFLLLAPRAVLGAEGDGGADPVERARSEAVADLPPIDGSWWEAIRDRPWGETYPQIFHHTWIVPARWADLALRCARAQRRDPASGPGEKGVRVLLGLSAYSCEARHYDVGMNAAVWGVDALEAYRILEGRLYPGVRQLRTLIVTGDRVVDVLQARADRERDLAWTVHVDGRPTTASASPRDPVELPEAPAWRYLRDPRRAPIEDRYGETFRSGELVLRLDVLVDRPGDAAAEVVACGFPVEEGAAPETVPMRMLRLRSDRAVFVAVYRSGARAKEPLEVAVTDGALESLRIDLRHGGRRLRHRVPRLR